LKRNYEAMVRFNYEGLIDKLQLIIFLNLKKLLS
jgi:hypothetical protein